MKLLNISALSLAATSTAFAFSSRTSLVNVNTDIILPVAFSMTIFHATLSSAYALPFPVRFSSAMREARQTIDGTDNDQDDTGDVLGPGDTIDAAGDKQNATATEKKKHKHHHHNQTDAATGDQPDKNKDANANGNNNDTPNAKHDHNGTDTNANKDQNGKNANGTDTSNGNDNPKKGTSTGTGTLPSGFPPATPNKGFIAGQKL